MHPAAFGELRIVSPGSEMCPIQWTPENKHVLSGRHLSLLGGGYGFRSGNTVLGAGGGFVGLILLILLILALLGRLPL